MVGGAVDYALVDISIFDTSSERFALIPHACRTGGGKVDFYFFDDGKQRHGRGAEKALSTILYPHFHASRFHFTVYCFASL